MGARTRTRIYNLKFDFRYLASWSWQQTKCYYNINISVIIKSLFMTHLINSTVLDFSYSQIPIFKVSRCWKGIDLSFVNIRLLYCEIYKTSKIRLTFGPYNNNNNNNNNNNSFYDVSMSYSKTPNTENKIKTSSVSTNSDTFIHKYAVW